MKNQYINIPIQREKGSVFCLHSRKNNGERIKCEDTAVYYAALFLEYLPKIQFYKHLVCASRVHAGGGTLYSVPFNFSAKFSDGSRAIVSIERPSNPIPDAAYAMAVLAFPEKPALIVLEESELLSAPLYRNLSRLFEAGCSQRITETELHAIEALFQKEFSMTIADALSICISEGFSANTVYAMIFHRIIECDIEGAPLSAATPILSTNFALRPRLLMEKEGTRYDA